MLDGNVGRCSTELPRVGVEILVDRKRVEETARLKRRAVVVFGHNRRVRVDVQEATKTADSKGAH